MSSKLEMWLLPAAAEAGMVELFVVPALGRRNPATPPEGRPVNRAAALGSVWAVLREGSGGAGSGGGSAISGGYQFIVSCAAGASRSCFSSAMGGFFCWRFFKSELRDFLF